MAEPGFQEEVDEATQNTGDVEMGEGAGEDSANANGSELPFTGEEGPKDPAPPRTSFAQYLQTPVVTLLVGSGEAEAILTAHQGLLVQSSYFAESCAEFTDDGSVSATTAQLSRTFPPTRPSPF
jgi:hypothetical protein